MIKAQFMLIEELKISKVNIVAVFKCFNFIGFNEKR